MSGTNSLYIPSIDTSIFELLANKAIDFSVLNNTLYPTTLAVYNLVNLAIGGLNPTSAVSAATTTILPNTPTYNNGTAGLGATLESSTNSTLVVDGYTVLLNERVLVKNQSDPVQNGIYVLSQVGDGSNHWKLTRDTDYDTPVEINNTGSIPVVNGVDNSVTSWLNISNITSIGTDPILYIKFTLTPTTLALNTLSLAQFATDDTSSAELAGIMSDEVGYSAGAKLMFNNNPSINGLTLVDGTNIALSATTGTKIGTSTTQKLGFYNATPIVQPTGNIITALQNLGLVATGSISATDMAALLSTSNTWSAAQRGAFSVGTDASTITLNFATTNHFRVVLGGSRTLGVPSNLAEGQSGVINLWQDGTGSRTLAYAWCFQFAGGTAPTLSTGKYLMDQLTYMVNKVATSTVTISNASPGVITWNSHGLISGQKVQFTTTGTLPTGLSPSTTYWVNVASANTFNVASSLANLQAGTFINTSSTGSGTHTATCLSITINANLNIQ